MLYRNPGQSTEGSKQQSNSNANREVPKERDGANNPWKAMIKLGEENHKYHEMEKRQLKAQNKASLK